MSKKNIGLLLLVLVLGAIYVFNFTNIFHTPQMEITSKIRPAYSRRGKPPVGNTISFSLNDKYRLTSLKVVEERDMQTNKYPHAVWHLISDSHSEPVKTIVYGNTVEGMKPKIAKVKPETLKTNVSYVLLLEAGKVKGQTTFRVH